MSRDIGLIDEIFGVLVGAFLAYALLDETAFNIPRVYVLFIVPFLAVILAVGAHQHTLSERVPYYVVGAVGAMTYIFILGVWFPIEFDFAIYMLPTAIAVWSTAREAAIGILEWQSRQRAAGVGNLAGAALPDDTERQFLDGGLRTARRKHGLTQKALADQVGVSASTVGRWEREGKVPDAKTRAKLAEALGSDPWASGE